VNFKQLQREIRNTRKKEGMGEGKNEGGGEVGDHDNFHTAVPLAQEVQFKPKDLVSSASADPSQFSCSTCYNQSWPHQPTCSPCNHQAKLAKESVDATTHNATCGDVLRAFKRWADLPALSPRAQSFGEAESPSAGRRLDRYRDVMAVG